MATKQEYLDKAFEILKNNGEALSGPELKSRLEATAQAIADAYGDGALFDDATTSGFPAPACDPKKAIKDKSITCLVCGQNFKLLTAKHLASHGMTPKEYRAAYGYAPGASLCCKELKKFRADKMASMELWKRKGETKPVETTKGKGKAKGKAKDSPSDSLPETTSDMAAANV